MSDVVIDPVCAFHGKHWSEHEGGRCLYCCICFETLTPDECWADSAGHKWDVCQSCGDAAEIGDPARAVDGDPDAGAR